MGARRVARPKNPDADRLRRALAARELDSAPEPGDSGNSAPGTLRARRVPPINARKSYMCPGCNQEIGVGVGHVVAVPAGQVEDRRHWHEGCWRHRANRRPGRPF